MAFDLEGIVKDLVSKITGDKELMQGFQKDPIGTLEKKLGIDLPDEQLNAVVTALKAKICAEGAASLMDKVKGLFGK